MKHYSKKYVGVKTSDAELFEQVGLTTGMFYKLHDTTIADIIHDLRSALHGDEDDRDRKVKMTLQSSKFRRARMRLRRHNRTYNN